MLLCTPVFYLWNPPWACVVMTLYGFAANLPCILVQRANRIKIERILRGANTTQPVWIQALDQLTRRPD